MLWLGIVLVGVTLMSMCSEETACASIRIWGLVGFGLLFLVALAIDIVRHLVLSIQDAITNRTNPFYDGLIFEARLSDMVKGLVNN